MIPKARLRESSLNWAHIWRVPWEIGQDLS